MTFHCCLPAGVLFQIFDHVHFGSVPVGVSKNCQKTGKQEPGKHTASQKRRYNVAVTSRRCNDVVATLCVCWESFVLYGASDLGLHCLLRSISPRTDNDSDDPDRTVRIYNGHTYDKAHLLVGVYLNRHRN